MDVGRDKSGALLYMHYTGIVEITPGVGAILSGSPDAKTTDFGNACKIILLLGRTHERNC